MTPERWAAVAWEAVQGTPSKRDDLGVLARAFAAAISAAVTAERERCARLAERAARRIRDHPGILWSCAAVEVEDAADDIREGREP